MVTDEKEAEEVADKVLADWAKGVDPRESEEANGEGGNKPSEASLGLPKPLGEKGASAQEGVEPSKTNPLAWLAHTAEMFKDEQVQKAKDGLVKAKESGDAEDIKRATADMKQAMETKLRGNGIGLVERRRIIGREIGKILGEEAGKAEAEKIDKPWEQMDLEEREAVSSKNPLTETEINELTSEENRELIPAALAYLRGDKGNIINAISYFKIWNDVRSRHENVPDNSGAKDGTQLDAPDTGGSQELGLGRGRESGRPDGSVDRGAGNEAAPGERNSREGNQNDTTLSAGEQGNKQGEGNTSRMGTVPAGGSDTNGGGSAGRNGNVPKRGGQGGGNRPLDPNAGRKPTAKQGTHFPDSTSERLKQERAEYEQKKKDFWERWKKAGQGYMKISLTPFKALNLSPEQIEMLPELFKMHLNGAVLKIKEGIYKFNEWKAAMRAEEGEELKMIGLSDDDIDRFIEDYWNTPYQMDGETHTIGEWAGIHGNEKLRNKLSEPLNDKYQRQVDAEPIKVKIGDKKNIEETLPYLLPQQQEDVLRAETQFFGNEHADREHAYGKGYMFTNGTGTGKTFTGLGVAKRLVKQGKGRILIVTPSQKKVSDWIKDGRNLNMEIRDLDSIAKERGTTATTESGEGVVITTFANFGVNKKLLETKWDAVIYDESHRIMENKNGTETARSMQHYMVTNRSENHCFLRLQETNKDYQKMKSLGERFDAERGKEVKRIQDEYKASHPSATPRDVAYATSRMLPKERNGFTPGDYASFPKLGNIHAEFVKALSHYTNEVEPKLKAQAKNEWKDTKTIFLSATPFNTRENLDYAEGYIFKYPEVEKGGRMSGRTQFYLDHFGAAYKFRYNRLEQSTSNPEAVAKQEIEFSDYLQHTLGTMSGRIIDSPYDYSRDFPTVSPDHAEEFNQAVQEAVRGHEVLAKAYNQTIGDYNYGSALFETMKVANIIERIKAHLDAGRKVVIFHRRVETKEPLKPPFASMLEQANRLIAMMRPGEEQKKAIQAVKDFRKKYADLLEWEQTLDYSMPREQIAKVFGKDKVLFFSGKESTKVKDKAVDTFNSDDSGKNIIVIQEASGKEGISLHDTTGKHQRVCITLALPQSPITALQIEGRTYRIGNKSNAIFEYPILGLNSEMMLFGQKFNNQVSTTENLALGSQARSLRDSFANGILEHSGVVPIDQQGVGGKEFDAPKDQSTDGFDNAVLDYYSNQKLNSRNREGVDYFPTPEPLGYKMMEWANMGEGDTVMEPSAGHGAIARYAPKGNQMVAIEPSQSLFTKLQLKAGGLGRKFQNTIFENYDISNKHDVVVMNPPFGTAGATAIAHLGKAFKHLEEGGRVVALIPRGSTDKKFEKWIEGEKTAVMRAEVELPDIVFKQAGTNVVCRVVVVDKISNEAMRAKAGSVEKWNLGGHYDKIEDFFEDLRDVEMPDRIIDTKAIMMKKSKQTVKDLKELKDVRVDFNEGGINVRVRGDWKDYSITFSFGGYNTEQRKNLLSGKYEALEQQERQTRNETSQAVIAELKKLTCKLAGMTEEEMQRYLKKTYEGKGVMENIAHSAEVYNNAKKIRFQKAPKEEQSEELYLSLQNKKGKEYYDTVDILSERIADGRADIRGLSERPGRKEANRISAGIEIIAASRDRQNEAGTAKSNETKLRLGRVATEKAIEEWAKSNDAVFAEEDIAKGAMDGKPSAEGGEAVVYVSNDFSKVTKLVDPYPRNNGSIQLCMENTRLFNRLFPDAAYTVKGVARDKNGKFRIVMEQPYLEGKQYSEDTMAEYENGPSQAKDALMESLGLHDVYGDGLEFRNDKYYVSDLHPGNIVFDSEGQPHVIDADVKYYGVFRRDNIEGKPLIVDNEAKEPKADTRNSEELFKSLKDKEGKEYYDTVTELAERMAGRTGRKEESVSEGQSQPRETSVGRNTERIVGRPKSVVHCAAEIIATDTERSYGNGGLQQSERGLERGEKNALVPREKSSQSEVSTAGVWENRVSDPVEREISKRIEDWAKQTNHWFDWRSLRTKYDRTKQLGDGTEAESDVFLSKDGETVLKVVRNPHALYTSLLGKLNSIALHNKLFGDVGQTIIGITRTTETDALGKDVSTIGLLIEQPFIEGKPVADMFNSYGEEIAYIDKTMTALGFKPEKWADNGGFFNGEPETVWRKGDVIVYDTHGNNIFIDKNGKPRLIDCGIETYKEYAKRHTIYDSAKARETEYENAVRAVKSEIRTLEKEVLNEERIIAMLRDNRREDNADKIDGFINYHEGKIAELKHNIRINAQAIQKPNSVHYRTEASLGLSKPLEGRIAETVEKVSKQTGGKVKMVNSVEEIGNEQVRRDIESGKKVTGWYDEKTGEVHLYMPNIHDAYTAEKTVWHETVGHKGMRGLLGDKFKDYMRGLWMDLDNPINAELRAYVKERMSKDSMGFYDAIEEFIAESVEKGKGEPGFWNNIKNKVTDALHEIGYRISPNVKDVKYMLWLAKNVQKKGNDPWWKMRADAVKWKIEHENVEYTEIHGGEFYENDGKSHDFEDMSREEWDEATDGQIHYRTAPSAATALDRYHKMLDAHGYMATEAFMDNMLSLDKLMRAVDPSIKKIEDVKSSMNPYILQNTMQGAMSDKMTLFEHQVMKPLDKAMSDVLDSFAGKNTEEKIRECNLYMIGKHGLERNRVLFVRDWFRKMEKTEDVDDAGLDNLDKIWKGERSDLRRKLDSGQIDLREYYRQMDEWIVQNIDKDFKAEEHDYSGMHGLQEIDDLKSPYDDAGAIDSVMSQEAKMESLKKGSVDNLWKRIKDATDYSIDSDYENGLMDKTRHDRVKNMFDWYVPLRKYDEATAEDVYGYISGDNGKGFIGETLMNAKGRKSLSDVNVLAQIGAMGNRAIRNGGQNAVKQAFARFVRNSGEQNLVKETKVWVEKKGTDMNGNDIWEEAYPQIPDNASAHDIATIVDAFETDMKTKQAKGEAKTLSNSTDIGFKFARAKNKSEHFVDVKIAGRTHRFVVMGNPRAAQALNGMLENSSPNSALLKGLKSTTRFMAQMATSYSPEFVMRNIIRDAEFASSNVTAKEGVMYGKKWLRYYAELNPLNVAYNEGAGALKSLKWRDLKEGVGMGLYARYREGTLGNSKMERYFKEFMQNGGETGWVQVKTMQEWEKDYKRDVSREHSKVAKTGKALRDFLVGNVENLNEVAENMARFATFCTSRDLGRSAVRSAYDAKQVSTNFNRHGSGDAIKTFKNGEMGTSKEMRRNVYGTIASYLRNYSMFFNAGVQSTHLLMNNVKKAPVGTVASMMAMPFGLGIMAAVVNNAMIASEDEKKRKGVKDPYGELPEYIRRNNLCIYKGGGEFVTIPLAIELRAFYGLGDIAAGMTTAKNVKSTRNAAMDAVGCMSQLLPVVDFMNSTAFDKEPGKETLKGVLPTAAAPFVEWWLNSDWKGTPIRREGDYTKNRPAWMNAYSGTPEKLMDLNKWVNAKTNDVAPGNENMRGNSLLDEATDPAMLNHIIGTLGGGAATFITRGTGLVLKYADGREQEIETKDIPFLRSLLYTPSEQTSMARTKAKWYGYKESMEKGTSNYSMLKNKNVPLTERIRNAADRHRFEQSADYARIRIIKDAEKQMKRWNKMKRLNADDKKQVDFANKNIEMIMQKAVEQMDKVSDD
ncbi:LPD38 domain-containing protein [uncultured Prevotella sp.]|uniref:putative polyvalent protein kinase domain-containing protein n=1 Tax=uncultured Prevotella sp. TaxID=159272 RepID=UPI002610ACE5|nr:LPD38 domain-containing protein [uncultured Prevotella sp.]